MLTFAGFEHSRFFAAICGYLLWNKPHTDILEAKALETNAAALYKIFITDSVTAKTTYPNAVLNVSGKVKSVSVNQQHQQIILLKTNGADASVNCTMEENATGIKAGYEVSLKGFCIGNSFYTVYYSCKKLFGEAGKSKLILCSSCLPRFRHD